MRELALQDRLQTDTVLRKVVGQSLMEGKAVAVWRMPDTKAIELIACEQPHALSELALEELPSGFLVGPFDTSRTKLFIPSEFHLRIENDTVQVVRTPAEFNIPQLPLRPCQWHIQKKSVAKETPAPAFADMVKQGVHAIEAGRLEKVVPSRVKDIALDAQFDLLQLFHSLADQYPHALVSLVSSPQTGTWLGATPELLVAQNNNGIFATVALAGTQPFVAGTDLKKISWTQKDIEEQAFVSRYIINCFKKIRLREYEEHGPRTYRAGNLLHLKTDYIVDTRATHFPQLASVMLKLLHPTSAVCGMPLEPALAFLRAHEAHDRELYTGFLGPVDVQGSTQLFVNLRCMQWFGNGARLYAGAGVTADSDPAAEWNETEMKMNTILKAIQH